MALTLEGIEDWLLEEARAVLGTVYTSIESGPGEWTERYMQSVIKSIPAVRVAFLGATARDSTALTVDTRWTYYLVNGYEVDEKERRRPIAPAIGVFRAARLLAPRVHNKPIPDPDQSLTDVERRAGRAPPRSTFVTVTDLENLWAGELDIWRVSLFAIAVTVPLALDEELDEGAFADFLRAGLDFDLPGEGRDVDLEAVVDIPQ